MVYTAATQSLAMLELLVQDDPLRARYVMIPAFIPADLSIEHLAANSLPVRRSGGARLRRTLAAQKHAPGLLDGAAGLGQKSRTPQLKRTGRWIRRGKVIILLGLHE